MTFLGAAEAVLAREGVPLSVKEIFEKAIEQRLIKTRGKTPEASLSAAIYVSIKGRGSDSPFVKVGKGRFGLASWEERAKEESSSTGLTFKQAAVKVLSEAQSPLDSQTITQMALSKGYLRTRGLTPQNTLGAQLYVDLKRKGDKSPFVQLGKNRFGLREWKIDIIRPQIEKEIRTEREADLWEGRKRSIVGDPVNVAGLTYGPLNENGVIFLFSKVADKLPKPIIIEAIQPAFPDARGRRKTEKGWEDTWIEFEYRSSSFKRHGHSPKDCDVIVCWEHDWKECPIEVIELKSVLKQLGLSR